jgi:hypothetical protein
LFCIAAQLVPFFFFGGGGGGGGKFITNPNGKIKFFLYFLKQDESEIGLGGNEQLWTLGVGLLFTAIAAAYVTRLAKVRTDFFFMDHIPT